MVWLSVAECTLMGTPISPKVMVPFQIERGICFWLPRSHRCTRACAGYAANQGKPRHPEGVQMGASTEETGHATGTKDKNYNLVWFTEQCLSNALRLETYIQDAERDGDSELADLFRRAQTESRKGGEQGKEYLRKRLG